MSVALGYEHSPALSTVSEPSNLARLLSLAEALLLGRFRGR
jgi:hypothetical protein